MSGKLKHSYVSSSNNNNKAVLTVVTILMCVNGVHLWHFKEAFVDIQLA